MVELFGVIGQPKFFILNSEGGIIWPKKAQFPRRGDRYNLLGVRRVTVSDKVPQTTFYLEREAPFIKRLKLILNDMEPVQGHVQSQSINPKANAVERVVHRRYSWAMQDGKLSEEGLAKVVQLVFKGTDLQDSDLKDLRKYNYLEQVLILDSPQVTDAGFVELAKIQQIKRLTLSGPWLTDATLNELAEMKHLKRLTLSNSKATVQGQARLREALPECDVVFMWPSTRSNGRKVKHILPSVSVTLPADEKTS